MYYSLLLSNLNNKLERKNLDFCRFSFMTINIEMYQKILQKQSSLGAQHIDIRPKHLWKIIVSGDLDSAKYIFGNTSRKNSEISLQSGEICEDSS
jgi:hypothetical protein